LKYERAKPTGCRDIEIRKFEVVAKTQFLYPKFNFKGTVSVISSDHPCKDSNTRFITVILKI